MSDFDIKFGPWLNYGKSKIGTEMEELTTKPWSPFNGCDIAQIFIYCMAYAFAKGKIPKKPPSSGGGSMPASAFKRDMRDFMKALAVAHTKDLNVMADPKKVVQVAEGYAFAGFPEVYNRIKYPEKDSTTKSILESILQEIESAHNRKET